MTSSGSRLLLVIVATVGENGVPDAYIGLYLHVPSFAGVFPVSLKRTPSFWTVWALISWVFSAVLPEAFQIALRPLIGVRSQGQQGFRMARTSLETLPIGIDRKSGTTRSRQRRGIEDKIKRLRELPRPKGHCRRDRLDTVHGVVQKLEAFGMFC